MTLFYIILWVISTFAAYDHLRTRKDFTMDWRLAVIMFSALAGTFANNAYISYTG